MRAAVRIIRYILLLTLLMLPLTGCWDLNELTDWGFVQAAALDLTENGQVKMTTQIYRPGTSDARGSKASKGVSYITLSAEASTITEASLKIAHALGRSLNWSHMRSLLIGERVARNANVGAMFDFFTRSQGPRGTVNIMTTSGEAGPFLLINPLIENTIGQQLKTSETIADEQRGTSRELRLLDLSILAQTPNAAELLPHMKRIEAEHEYTIIDGLSILRFPEGTIHKKTIPTELSPYVLMVRKEFKSGLLAIPCADAKNNAATSESYWINHVETKMEVTDKGGSPLIRIRLKLSGSIGELKCSDVNKEGGNERFLKRVEEEVEADTRTAVKFVQGTNADVLLAGQYVQRRNPRLWAKWSERWPDYFSKAGVEVSVRAQITGTGMSAGDPFIVQSES